MGEGLGVLQEPLVGVADKFVERFLLCIPTWAVGATGTGPFFVGPRFLADLNQFAKSFLSESGAGSQG